MVKAKQDLYETLGISQNAGEKEINDAFRRLSLKYHPDLNTSFETEQRFNEIVEAYLLLSELNKPHKYEQKSFAGFIQDSIFGSVFPRGNKTLQTKGQDLDIRACVTLEKIASGGDEVMPVIRQTDCIKCKGTGAELGSQLKQCGACSGSGQIVSTSKKHKQSPFQQITSCPVCFGKGMEIKCPCRECEGSGKINKEELLTITIPKGAIDGLIIRMPGQGLAAKDPSLPSGDLYICIESNTDPRFQRMGANLWHTKIIDITDAVLGAELKVPTLKGFTKLKIPAGTQTNEVFKIKKLGLPFQGSDQYGDLNIRIHVNIPSHISEAEKSLYEKLRAQGAEKQKT